MLLLTLQMVVIYSRLFVVIPVLMGVWMLRKSPKARRPFLVMACTWVPIYAIDALGGLGLLWLPEEALYRTLRQGVAVLAIAAVFWDLLATALQMQQSGHAKSHEDHER